MCLHWTQHENGWLRDIYDYSGATCLHLASGAAGIVGSSFLGRRLLRVAEIDRCSVAFESPSNTFIGYFLIIIGLLTSLLPPFDSNTKQQNEVFDAILVTNCLLAIAGALVTFILLHSCANSERFGYWDILKCLQSAVAALIALSYGVHYYLPSMALVIGAITSTIFYCVTPLIEFTPLEDNCNIIAIHFTGAIMGAVLLPIFCKWKVLGENATILTRVSKSAWQAVYCLIIVTFCAVIFATVFALLKATRRLRNKNEINNHNRAVHMEENRRTHWFGRLFKKRSTFPFAERPPDDVPSSFILETRGSERRRPWTGKRSQRKVSFLIHD